MVWSKYKDDLEFSTKDHHPQQLPQGEAATTTTIQNRVIIFTSYQGPLCNISTGNLPVSCDQKVSYLPMGVFALNFLASSAVLVQAPPVGSSSLGPVLVDSNLDPIRDDLKMLLKLGAILALRARWAMLNLFILI